MSPSDAVDRLLAGAEPDEALTTAALEATGPALDALVRLADGRRRAEVGEVVRYVVNRNVNFTNVCVKGCRFCAFARGLRSEEGYLLPVDEVVRRVVEAAELGATEVCLQAGLLPDAPATTYLELVRAVKAAVPGIHVHAFSPEEVKHAASRADVSVERWLGQLIEVGVGSLPGTSAEILDPEVRRRIAPGRIRVDEWRHIIHTAHRLGLPTTSTMMFGHVETARHRARHLLLLRDMQRVSGGFTEFVPLSFVAAEAPLRLRDARGVVRDGPTEDETVAVFAVARLVLGEVLPHLQVSWVKEGPERAVRLLSAGADDLGGTLVNESISTAAGARFGQRMSPAGLQALAWAAGRPAQERTTLYAPRGPVLRGPEDPRPEHPLDAVAADDPRFGSFAALAADPRFRYEPAGAQRAQSSGVSRSRSRPGEDRSEPSA